jgi:hypothetical protein
MGRGWPGPLPYGNERPPPRSESLPEESAVVHAVPLAIGPPFGVGDCPKPPCRLLELRGDRGRRNTLLDGGLEPLEGRSGVHASIRLDRGAVVPAMPRIHRRQDGRVPLSLFLRNDFDGKVALVER